MRRPFLFLIFSILATLAYAQDVKVDFNDGEFFLAEEEYEEALFAFGKVYDKGYEENAYLNYRMGLCLINIPGRKTEAIPYLEKAVQSISIFHDSSCYPVTARRGASIVADARRCNLI